ncbi:hypothetical protein I3843_12G040400 [Carya illinoinensis]|nr:hypothetical protein I3843_12G040400 [Carya illinoinensis]
MENIKVLYLKCLLRRTGTTELENLVKALGRIEQDCRKCYAGVVGLSVENFIEMMVIDGCFMLEFLSRYLENRMVLNVNGEKDPVFKTSWMPRKIIADLLLLENQLPWCVLDCLFNSMPSLKTTHQRCSRLDDLVSFSFSEYKIFPAAHSARSHEKHAQFLDCFRNCLVGSCTLKRRNYSEALEWKPVKPVTELILHGIIPLKAKSRDNILDVKFKNGLMEIPEIVIAENTESGYEITSYAALLDCLIKSPADALKLEQKGILRIIGLSNEDRASFLNRLLYNNDTSFNGFLYSDLCQDVNKICSSRLGLWEAQMRRHYFGEPWQLITFVLGIFASFYFSLIQTFIAVLSYKDSHSKSAK